MYFDFVFFRGIVPITCDEMFKTIKTNDDKNKVSSVVWNGSLE